jgi:NAD dependent epimerase/dehydratase
MENVVVTGADGFIGSHLVEELVRSGKKVKAFTYYNSFNNWGWLEETPKEILNEVEIFCGDIRDPNGVRTALKGTDCVYHLAALIAIPYSYHSPSSYIETNVNGTLNVLQAVKDFDIEKMVHTSTSEVYGTAQYVPIDEKHPLVGQSPYSASKIGADQIAYSFYSSFNLPVSIARPFNTYGPRQSARAVIPSIITQLVYSKNTTIELGSLTPTRDFNYVEDTVAGFISIANSKESIGETINLGSNFEISIEDTVKVITDILDVEIEIVSKEERLRPENSEVNRLWADNKKALKLLDFKPAYSGLDGFRKGMEKTIEWFSIKENLNKYKTDLYNI